MLVHDWSSLLWLYTSILEFAKPLQRSFNLSEATDTEGEHEIETLFQRIYSLCHFLCISQQN
jgi:hypothetical protein